MKKMISILLSFLIISTLTACEKNITGVRAVKPSTGVNDVLEAGMAEADKKNLEEMPENSIYNFEPEYKEPSYQDITPPEHFEVSSPELLESGDYDVDLTILSPTMAYSQLYYITLMPEDYIGKVMKVKGVFIYSQEKGSDQYYFSCFVLDDGACCAQGIEFIPTDEYSYPEDFPGYGEEFTLIGTFDTYVEGGHTYCTLRNAEIL